MIVAVGLAVTLEPVPGINPEVGDQLYAPLPPLAVKFAELPMQ